MATCKINTKQVPVTVMEEVEEFNLTLNKEELTILAAILSSVMASGCDFFIGNHVVDLRESIDTIYPRGFWMNRYTCSHNMDVVIKEKF